MLGPCPFCTSEKTQMDEVDENQWSVSCRVCGATGPISKNALLAEMQWNYRKIVGCVDSSSSKLSAN